MTDKKNAGVVEYTDADGKVRWAAEESKAYQDHLASKKSKPVSKADTGSTTKTPDAKS